MSIKAQENPFRHIYQEKEETPSAKVKPFSIIEEFMELSTRRRLLLCEQLFVEGTDFFTGTVNLLWPQASNKDIKKLESFLVILRETYFKDEKKPSETRKSA